jgi:membrane protein
MASDRSFVTIFGDIFENLRGILRGEVRLATAEVLEGVVQAKAAGILFATAVGLGLLGVAYVGLAVVFILAEHLATWASALLVAAAFLVAAGLCVLGGLRAAKKVSLPRSTALAKETLQWPST